VLARQLLLAHKTMPLGTKLLFSNVHNNTCQNLYLFFILNFFFFFFFFFAVPANSLHAWSVDIDVWNEGVTEFWSEGLVSLNEYLGSIRIDDAADPTAVRRPGVRSMRRPLSFRSRSAHASARRACACSVWRASPRDCTMRAPTSSAESVRL
jgi:hypothetical protein